MAPSLKSLLSLTSLTLACTASAALIDRDAAISPQNTINVDVCVIGGGAAGTYAAIKSKDLGHSVAVVERQNRLGGHTKTYIDPATKKSIELGVAEWEDTPIVRNFFKRFGVALYKYNFTLPGVSTEYADFTTGKLAVPRQGDLLGAWDAFQAQVAKYPSLDYDLSNVPYAVPPDLLLPFGDFIRKYKLEDAVSYLSLYGEGWGNFVTLPTLLAVKFFPPYFFSPESLFGGGEGALAAKDNSEIYDKATSELGASALLSSSVVSMDRSNPALVKITVKTPTGKKLIKAKKLISAIPPLIDNLGGFDLDQTEKPIFNKFQGHSWYVGLVNNSGVPDNLTLLNYGASNPQNFNISVVPGVYATYATVVPGLHYFLFGGNDSQPTLTKSYIRQGLKDTLERLRAQGTIPPTKKPNDASFNIIEFSSHTPYEVFVPSKQIAKGFYNRLFELQGRRNTYWTGAAFVTHSSAAIWNYTNRLVEGIWREGAKPVALR